MTEKNTPKDVYENFNERLNKFQRASRITFGVLFFFVGVGAGILANYISEKSSQAVKKELSGNISRIKDDVKDYSTRIKAALHSSRELQKRVNDISSTIGQLTTEQINTRLDTVEERIKGLNSQLETLQNIIDPKKATEILNVKRMSEEIFARENLEGRVQKKLENYSNRLLKLDDKLTSLQYWIWGSLLTIIGGLIGAVVYLGKQSTRLLGSFPTNQNVNKASL